ncbi:MAG: AAA family ATPase [Magnetococcales bacterium]|nr:AAA family ATPase [Magnetococcales bacterium]
MNRNGPPSLAELEEALSYLPPDLPRSDWILPGMAVHAAYPGEDGFRIFDDWSRGGASYNSKDCRDVWRSFKPDGGIGVGTLFDIAKKYGLQGATRAANPQTDKASLAAAKATRIWQSAQPARANGYLERKGVQPVASLREIALPEVKNLLGYHPRGKGGPLEGETVLVVPVKSMNGALTSIELIDSEGRKHFLAGGAVSGGSWATGPFPEDDGADITLLLGEGVGTVLSGSEAYGGIGVAALMDANLPSVARNLRERYPKADLVILADVKESGEPNAKAVEAAKAMGVRLAVPDFGQDNRNSGLTDVNDLMRHRGLEAVRCCIEKAQRLAGQEEPSFHAGAVMRCLNDIQAEPIDWLWPGRYARNKPAIDSGEPGCGKSQKLVDMAARVSTGQPWPDGTPCPLGTVFLLTAEDDPADTLRPRLEAAGANLSKVFVLDGVCSRDSRGRSIQRTFNLAEDIEILDKELAKHPDAVMVGIDPISAYLGGTDSHNNADVRGLLAPLAKLAQAHQVAVVMVTHLNKGAGNAVSRVTGSGAFVAAARAAFLVAKDPHDPERRLFLPIKNNIGNDSTGLAFRIESVRLESGIETSRIAWEPGAVTLTADRLLNPVGSTRKTSLSEAEDFLSRELANGAVPAEVLKQHAAEAGISETTLNRAKTEMGIMARKKKGVVNGGWEWALN